MKTIGDRVFSVLVGVVVLGMANLWLDPVPLAAALAWALGLLLFWTRQSPSLWPAVAGLLGGATLGAIVHLLTHLGGRSPPPAEGLAVHVLFDAALGVMVGALALAASLGRHLWRRMRHSD